MIGMQLDMQQNYFPGYYSNGDHNLNGGCSNVNYTVTNGHYYNGSTTLATTDQHFECKEMLKQIMLQHEATFRSQVRELHRLYKRQRELMDEVNRSNLHNHHLQQGNLRANPFLLQHSFNSPNKTCQISSFPWLNPAVAQENCWQASNGDVQIEGPKESFELSDTKFKKVGKKVLDLELPADEYIDSEEDESPVETRARSSKDDDLLVAGDDNHQAPFSRNTEGLADLNEPIKLEEETNIEFNCHGESSSDFQVIANETTQIIETDNDEAGQSSSLLLDQSAGKSQSENQDPGRSESEISTNGYAGKVYATCMQPSNPVTNMINDESCKRRKHIGDPVRAPIIVQALPCKSFFNKKRFGKGVKAYMNFQNSSEIEICVEDSIDGKAKQVIDLNCTEDDGPCNNKKSPGYGFALDLNSCINEADSSPTSPLSAEIATMEVPASPESEGNLYEASLLEERIKIAAKAIVAISSERSNPFSEPVQHSKFNSLSWLSRISSSVVDDPEGELGIALTWKETDFHDGYLSDGIDYFEAMTLKLKDANLEDQYCFIAQNEGSPMRQDSLPSLPSKARTRRGKQQRKDFQNEILPSLASLSRQEVSKDLRAIGNLIHLRNHKNGHLRGRRRRTRNFVSSPSNMERDCASSLKQKTLVGWGKITRRRRGPRCAASNPRFILGQAL